MAVTFVYNEALGPDDLRIELRDGSGATFDPAVITYSLWYNNPLYSRQMWGQSGRTPQRLSQGVYYAVESFNSSYPYGDYYIEWSIKRTNLSPTEIVRSEFAIMAISPYPIAASVPPCSGCGDCGGGCSCSNTLAGLSDVQLGNLANGQVLIYNSGLQLWQNSEFAFGSAAFLDAGTLAGQVLLLQQNNTLPALDGSNLTALGSIDLHSDVDIEGIQNGQILVWNSLLNSFIPGNGGGGGGGDVLVSILGTADYAPVQGIVVDVPNLANNHALFWDAGSSAFINKATGTATFANTGTGVGNVPVLGVSGLPAIGGSNLTSLGSVDLHSDVTIGGVNLATGQTLRYNFASSQWENKQLTRLDLSDGTDIATEQWVLDQIALGGGYTDAMAILAVFNSLQSNQMTFDLLNAGSTISISLDASLDDLNDVVFTPDPSKDGYVLTYKSGLGGWRAEAIPPSPIDLSAVAQNILPSVSEFFNLGSPDKIWKRIYLSADGGLNLGGASFTSNPNGTISFTYGGQTNVLATLADLATAYTDADAISAVGNNLALGGHTGISFEFNAGNIIATVDPLALNNLTDVQYVGARQNGQVLKFNGANNLWRNAFLSYLDLSDNNLLITTNNISNYLDNAIGLDNLTDVTIGGVALAEGQTLRYNLDTQQWENSKLNLSDLDGAITGQLVYRGGYNPNTGLPDVSNAISGDFYVITQDGTLFGIDVFEGDFIIFKQNAGGVFDLGDIDIIHNQTGVQSVNNLTGVVTLTSQNITENVNLYFTEERAKDAVAPMFTHNGHTGVSFAYDNVNRIITATIDNLYLDDITDVVASNPNDGDFLVFSNGNWINQSFSQTQQSLSDLSDVFFSGVLTDTNVLKYNTVSGKWENKTLSAGDISGIVGVYAPLNSPSLSGNPLAPLPDGSILNQIATVQFVNDSLTAFIEGLDWLTDVTITLPLVTGQTLRYNTITEQWENSFLYLNDLYDVSTAGVLDRKVLVYSSDAGSWVADYLNVSELDGYNTLALLTSPIFTGIPEAPTAPGGTKSNQIATTAFVNQSIQDIIGAEGLFLRKDQNLGDLLDTGLARSNLGLGTASLEDTGTDEGQIPVLVAGGQLPAIGGSNLTSLGSIDLHSDVDTSVSLSGQFLGWDGDVWTPTTVSLLVGDGLNTDEVQLTSRVTWVGTQNEIEVTYTSNGNLDGDLIGLSDGGSFAFKLPSAVTIQTLTITDTISNSDGVFYIDNSSLQLNLGDSNFAYFSVTNDIGIRWNVELQRWEFNNGDGYVPFISSNGDAIYVTNGTTDKLLLLGDTLSLTAGDNLRVLHNGDGVFTFTLTDTVIVNESLVVAGNSFEQSSVKFKDPMILLGNLNESTTNNVGFFGYYRRQGQGTTTFTTGLLYDPVALKYNLFKGKTGILSTDQVVEVSETDRADLNVKGLDTSGSMTNLVTFRTGAVVTLGEHHVYIANSGDSVILPLSVDGRRYLVKRNAGVGGNVVLTTTGGQTIDGVASKSITSEFGYIEVIGDGSNWFVILEKNVA